jgi:hypothetical protein
MVGNKIMVFKDWQNQLDLMGEAEVLSYTDLELPVIPEYLGMTGSKLPRKNRQGRSFDVYSCVVKFTDVTELGRRNYKVGYTTRIKIVVSSSEKLDKKNKKTLTGIAINNHKLERIRSTTDKYYNKNKYQKFFAKRLEDINLLAEISPDTYDLYNEFRNDKFIMNAF